MRLKLYVSDDPHTVAQTFARTVLAVSRKIPPTVAASKRTRVTATDEHGRILETLTVEEPERRVDLNAYAIATWERMVKSVEAIDKEFDTACHSYLLQVSEALGSKSSFTARLKALATVEGEAAFWAKAHRWEGSPQRAKRLQAAHQRSIAFRRELIAAARTAHPSPCDQAGPFGMKFE